VKYSYDTTENNSHWTWCEKNNTPYIVISQVNEEYSRIFYDATNLSVNLDEISDSMRSIYKSYSELFLIPGSVFAELIDDYYLFSIIVKKEHAEVFADAIFDYIKDKFIEKK
jgi:hypothetical protein